MSGQGHGGSASIQTPDYWWYVARAALLETALGRYAEGARIALDIGSADGPSAAWFRTSTERTASLDIDPRGLGADGVCGSAMELPFPDSTFDVVCAFDVVEHCVSEEAALGEIARVLRPGGRLLMSVPAYEWAWTDFDDANGHHRRYTRPRAVAAVERAGLRVERATYAFSSVFPMFVAERLARRLLRRRGGQGAQDIVEVPAVPRPLHHVLMALSALDRRALLRRDLPFGSSVFVAAARP